MFDFRFDWNNEFNIGIQEMDNQHKELFRIGRDMEQLILIQCIGMTKEDILRVLCELRDYTTYHFYMEEQLIASVDVEIMKQHKIQHEFFKEQINNVDCEYLVNYPVEGFKKIKDMLQSWIFQHMLIDDKEILGKIAKL